jgi:hypothetical protein
MPALMSQAATALVATASTIVSTSSIETSFFMDIPSYSLLALLVDLPAR